MKHTWDTLTERDLMMMLHDHLVAETARLEAALFTGPTPLINTSEPWKLALALEVIGRRAANAPISSKALMIVMGHALGVAMIKTPDVSPRTLTEQMEAQRRAVPEGPSTGAIMAAEAEAAAGQNQHVPPVDRAGAGLGPDAPIRVVRAHEVATAVMTVITDNDDLGSIVIGWTREEAQGFYNTLTTKIAAMITQGLH